MVALYKDPQGNSNFDKADAADSGNTHHNNVLNINDDSLDKETIVHLRKRIKELESALSSGFCMVQILAGQCNLSALRNSKVSAFRRAMKY